MAVKKSYNEKSPYVEGSEKPHIRSRKAIKTVYPYDAIENQIKKYYRAYRLILPVKKVGK